MAIVIGKTELILICLVAVALLALVARKIRIPYPILLTLGGVLLALVPGLPPVLGLAPASGLPRAFNLPPHPARMIFSNMSSRFSYTSRAVNASAGELGEVPAHDLRRGDPEPAVPAVVPETARRPCTCPRRAAPGR